MTRPGRVSNPISDSGKSISGACFQKAFAGEDLARVANRWDDYIRKEKLESSLLHDKIRDFHKKMTTPAKEPNTGGGTGMGGSGMKG